MNFAYTFKSLCDLINAARTTNGIEIILKQHFRGDVTVQTWAPGRGVDAMVRLSNPQTGERLLNVMGGSLRMLKFQLIGALENFTLEPVKAEEAAPVEAPAAVEVVKAEAPKAAATVTKAEAAHAKCAELLANAKQQAAAGHHFEADFLRARAGDWKRRALAIEAEEAAKAAAVPAALVEADDREAVEAINEAGGLAHVMASESAALEVQDQLDDMNGRRLVAVLNLFAVEGGLHGLIKTAKAAHGHSGIFTADGRALHYVCHHIGAGSNLWKVEYIADNGARLVDDWSMTRAELAKALADLFKDDEPTNEESTEQQALRAELNERAEDEGYIFESDIEDVLTQHLADAVTVIAWNGLPGEACFLELFERHNIEPVSVAKLTAKTNGELLERIIAELPKLQAAADETAKRWEARLELAEDF